MTFNRLHFIRQTDLFTLRLAQALAEIPGGAALDALTRLARDENRTVALTATAILCARDGGR